MRRSTLFVLGFLIAIPLLRVSVAITNPPAPQARDSIEANTVECRRLIIASPDSPGRIEAVAYKGVSGLYLTSGDESVELVVKEKGKPQVVIRSAIDGKPTIKLDHDGIELHDLVHGVKRIGVADLFKLAK